MKNNLEFTEDLMKIIYLKKEVNKLLQKFMKILQNSEVF